MTLFYSFSFQWWNGVSFIALYGNASGIGEFVAEEIVAFIFVFRADAQQTCEGVGEPSRGDGAELCFLDALPEFGMLLAKLWRSIDEEGDINSGMVYVCSVTKESAFLWFVHHFAVVREIKHKGALRRVVLYYLFEQMVCIAQRVEIGRFLTFRILCAAFLHILGFEKVKRWRITEMVGVVVPHEMNDRKTWSRDGVRENMRY